MAAYFEAGWRVRSEDASGPPPKRRPTPSAAAVFWGPRAEHIQSAASESFVGGVDSPIDDVVSRDGEFEESYNHDTLGPASSATDRYELAGSRGRVVLDEQGEPVSWPWATRSSGETLQTSRASSRSPGASSYDALIRRAIANATVDGKGGASHTGVTRWRRFCASQGVRPDRPLDPNASLTSKLNEEWLVMRFVAFLVKETGIKPRTAANYLGAVQGWHARQHGIKLAAGLKLERLPAMIKGMRRIYGDTGRRVRRGVPPQLLRQAMDLLLDPTNRDHVTIRAALSLGLQGLLRGAEFAVDGAQWKEPLHLSRADVITLTEERLVVMMRPCKNMNHLTGETVSLVMGAGGTFIDAVADMRRLFEIDPVNSAPAKFTPLFRLRSGSPIMVDMLRDWVKRLMQGIGLEPAHFGAHSLRIGGATALFAAGADPNIIRTMGRLSSDCYRLYVHACFNQTLEWMQRAGSTVVDDVAGEFEEVDCY